MVLPVSPWRSCGCNVPHRLRQERGVALLDAVSARRVMIRKTLVAIVTISQTWIARWQGCVAKRAAIHPQRARVAAARLDVVWWAKSCSTMRPNDHLSVFRLLRALRCRQIAHGATEGEDQGAASDDW